MSPTTCLVTGGAGFIGSNFVRHVLQSDPSIHVVNLDLLTYAGSRNNLKSLPSPERHTFIEGSITDSKLVQRILEKHNIGTIINFAAESHVDRSITGPGAFVQTNIVGTYTLLEAARDAWSDRFDKCRFLHVSTDEVYGDLGPDDPPFTENTPYRPSSPYAASKASSDHLVSSYFRTYNLPTLITNCSNNYGPYQYPEKLIPLIILNAVAGKALPVYGNGMQIRDWIHVQDHCVAISELLSKGRMGQTYNIGGHNEIPNITIVHTICDIVDELRPRVDGESYAQQIEHVADRPGHDRRYAVNCSKIQHELGWAPTQSFAIGLRQTVQWYLAHQDWVNDVMSENYEDWIRVNYSGRDEAGRK